MPARDDRDRDAATAADTFTHGISPTRSDTQFDSIIRETLARHEIPAIINQRRAITDEAREACERCADVSRAADDQMWLRLDALEEETHIESLLKVSG